MNGHPVAMTFGTARKPAMSAHERDASDAGYYFLSAVFRVGTADSVEGYEYLRQLAHEYMMARDAAIIARLQTK